MKAARMHEYGKPVLLEGVPVPDIKIIRFDQINEYLDLMRAGEVVGRAVLKF